MRHSKSNLLFAILCTGQAAQAALYTDFSQLPRTSFDFVIVGGGTAGNVLANRLTENSAVDVLVIEAGVSDEGVLPAIIPFLAPTITPNTPYDWNYTVVPQEGLNSRVFPYNRGKILGGSSTVNYLIHQYGSSDDYDKLASITGDPGWSWTNMKKYIYKHEKFNPGVNGTGRYVPENHGTNGTTSVGLTTYPYKIDDKVLEATKQLSNEFPFNPDTSGGENVLGIGWMQSSIKNGSRSSSSTSYLHDAITRPNLSVLIEHQVIKLLRQDKKLNEPVFNGVLVSRGPNAIAKQLFAEREVILSAGTVGTPQLLLISGIGSKEDVESHGISSAIDIPAVGKNLVDHVGATMSFNAQNLDTLDPLVNDPTAAQTALDTWTKTRSGPYASTLANQFGFFRLPSNASVFSVTTDPASGPKAAHWELAINDFGGLVEPSHPLPVNASFIGVIVALVAPSSRGYIKLASADPFDKPIIDPRFLTTTFDIFTMREAFRAVKRLMKAPAFSGYILGPYGSSNAETDEDIDEFFRSYSATVWHAVGTAAMSTGNSKDGVVDASLKIKGAKGLRVVDASIWPFVPCAHTQGPTYLIAERAADIIKKEHKI
ncbi:hypothetical protein CPB83DRAFT_757126 [Crepidotus variabilis]|uniref:pyranose dehydrogenase (acceptor) n=1 Tax=Crepidotus variabilis TaxID=179855 RepID=A0A9P6JVB7_9AGAR|nr:hypothetical protein CPB83DRAFT_757126 [Crepidotus variabilis]